MKNKNYLKFSIFIGTSHLYLLITLQRTKLRYVIGQTMAVVIFISLSAILRRILKINSTNPRTYRIGKNCHFWCHLCIADWTACVHCAFAHTNYGNNNNVDVCFISILFNVNNNGQRQ